MVELTSCYFCGAIDDLREFPIVPRELYPPEDVQRRVAVCPTCREKFARAIQPLIDYLEPPDDADADVEAEVSTEREPPEARAPSTRPDEAGHDRPGPVGDGAAPGAGGARTVDDGSDPTGTATAGRTADGRTAGREAPPERDGAEDTGGGGSTPRLADLVEDRPVYSRSRPVGYQWEPGRGEVDESLSFPNGTSSVARLLENSALPVERARIEARAADEHGIDPERCGQIVDTLVSRGYLEETDGALSYPDGDDG